MLALLYFAEGGEGPNTELLWVLFVLLGFFALAVIVGWAAELRKPKQALVEKEAGSSSSSSEADDLLKIEGIGPKVARVLSKAGITTFSDLAHAKPREVQQLLDEAGLQMLNPEGWIDQAKLAEKGDWTGFEKLQSKLKGGRKKK